MGHGFHSELLNNQRLWDRVNFAALEKAGTALAGNEPAAANKKTITIPKSSFIPWKTDNKTSVKVGIVPQ